MASLKWVMAISFSWRRLQKLIEAPSFEVKSGFMADIYRLLLLLL
jgi:hypothetical protein